MQWHLYFLIFLSIFVNTSNKYYKKNLLPRTKDPSCLFEPKIALFGFDGGLPMLSIRYCAINITKSVKGKSTAGYISTKSSGKADLPLLDVSQ